MKDLDELYRSLALRAQASAERLHDALDTGDKINGVLRCECGTIKLRLEYDGDIHVQAILDLADLLRREPLR